MCIRDRHVADWFPGWTQYGHTNRQPNDDGLSEQDCVELRRSYHLPTVITSPIVPNERLTDSFMWNDRDCSTLNYFLCEKQRSGAGMYTRLCTYTVYRVLGHIIKSWQRKIVNYWFFCIFIKHCKNSDMK